jgi:hypothetical protein
VFRIRTIRKSGKDPIAVVALKGNAVLVNGISRVEEEEQNIDIDIARKIINDPNHIPEAAKSYVHTEMRTLTTGEKESSEDTNPIRALAI